MGKEKDLTSSDVLRLMMHSYRRFKNGEISESQATKENALLGNILKAIEAKQSEERLKSIEETLSFNLQSEIYEDE